MMGRALSHGIEPGATLDLYHFSAEVTQDLPTNGTCPGPAEVHDSNSEQGSIGTHVQASSDDPVGSK